MSSWRHPTLQISPPFPCILVLLVLYQLQEQVTCFYPIILSWALLQHQVLSPYSSLPIFVPEALTRVAQMMSVSGSKSGVVRGILSSFPVPSLCSSCAMQCSLPLQIFLHCCTQDCRSQHPVSGVWKDPAQWWGVPGNASNQCRSMQRLGKTWRTRCFLPFRKRTGK